MRAVTIIGIILIIIGIVSLVYQGISYTTQKNVADLGPLKVQSEEKHTIPLPPILGAVALVGGIVLVIIGGRKT